MAFLKTARAALVHPNWSPENWGNWIGHHRSTIATGPYRTASNSPNLVVQASEILQEDFDPRNYLLTHATIVASVDTEDVPNVKLGTINELGRQIDRRWPNYHITPETERWTNNNGDSWDRPVLLKSYRTFVGAHNWVEHVQVEEQTKGRVIDAVARDIGPSIYVDILTATHRKHANLIRDIESGRLNTLSMGCSVTETQCTKCGNVAADETEMCPCVKYEKHNVFFDNRGVRRKVAELCGHHTLDPTGGVNFIEASWVAVPAFAGAVTRNILEPETINIETQDKVRNVLASPPREWTEGDVQKAASFLAPSVSPRTKVSDEAERRRQERHAQLAPEPEPGGAPGGPPEAAPPGGPPPMPGAEGMGMPGMMPGMPGAEEEKDPLEALEDEVEKFVIDKVKKKLRKKLQEDVAEKAVSEPELGASTNENINHQAKSQKIAALVSGTSALLRVARSDVELLDKLATLSSSLGIEVSRDLYRAALRVGSTEGHPSLDRYLSHAAEVLGRKPTTGEAKTLVRLGRILSLRKKTRF